MKRLKFYVCDAEVNINNINNYFKKLSNSLLFEKNNKYYFQSKFNNNIEEVEILISVIDFNEELEKTIKAILDDSYEMAMEISSEPIDGFENNSIYSEISTTINKYCYQECKSMFDFIAELFYKYLMGHHLKNGNKRLSICFLISLLWFFGYYLKWTKPTINNENFKNYKSQLEKWVEKFQNQMKHPSNDDIIKNISEIKEWLMNNVIIALNWR